MVNSWFTRTTSGYASWAAREVALVSSVEKDLAVLWAVITAVYADLSPAYNVALSGETGTLEGGGTIGPTAEATLIPTWHVLAGVESNLAPFWQITQHPDPLAGRLRIVGNQSTVSSTVFYAVQADRSATWLISDSAAADLTAYWSMGGGAAAAPSRGVLRLVGTTPTLTRSSSLTVTPAAGTIRLAGKTPTVVSSMVTEPTSGRLRIVGQDVIVQPAYLYPRTAHLRFEGQTPTIISPVFAEPSAGVLRLIGRGVVSADLTAEWPILDATAQGDLETFWNLNGSVSGYLWSYWTVESRVGAVTANMVHQTIQAGATTQPSMTARTTRNRITLRAA